MAVEIKVPALGESVTEATVAKWLVKAGDAVAVDEHCGGLRCATGDRGMRTCSHPLGEQDTTGEEDSSGSSPAGCSGHATSTTARPRGRLFTDSKPVSVQMTMSSIRAPYLPVS